VNLVQVDSKVISSRKYVYHMGGLQGLWPTRATETDEGKISCGKEATGYTAMKFGVKQNAEHFSDSYVLKNDPSPWS